MRIAQFAESYRPVINGAAVAVDLLAEELCRAHEVTVFAPHYPGHIDTGAVRRFPSYRWPFQRDYPLAIPFSPSLRKWFQKERFDLVHVHSPFALGQVGRAWARECGIPIVTTYHTLYEEYAHYAAFLPSAPVRRWLREHSRRFCEACDLVVVPTEPIREVLLSYGVRTPVHVVPTGLRLRPLVPEDPAFPRARFAIPAEAPLVLYAGRLAKEKNLELLFEGFRRVAGQIPSAWLLVAGSGPTEGEARRLAERSGVGHRVAFTGFIPPEEMPGVYAAAQVFAFSSLTDTQGLVLTEAKAAGVPVVSVDAFGPGVVVKHGVDGLLTPPDPAAFAAAIVQILEDGELRRRMGAAAIARARNFSIEATAESYVCLYENARRHLARRSR